eukprot:COSAG02_NODE_20569_length_825_cov_1.110193_1_plen_163_part_00
MAISNIVIPSRPPLSVQSFHHSPGLCVKRALYSHCTNTSTDTVVDLSSETSTLQQSIGCAPRTQAPTAQTTRKETHCKSMRVRRATIPPFSRLRSNFVESVCSVSSSLCRLYSELSKLRHWRPAWVLTYLHLGTYFSPAGSSTPVHARARARVGVQARSHFR